MTKVKVSIILPFYNPGSLINRCLDSLQKQTFADFEVLMIDDGSTDGAKEICTNFAITDPRFKYHQKANGGVSSARNLGIELADSEYIGFVDSDDFVDPGFLEITYAVASRHDAEILHFGHSYFKEGVEVLKNPPFHHDKYVSRNDLLEVLRHSASNKFLYFCWSRLFKTTFLRKTHIRFNEESLLGSDSLFNLETVLNASTMYAIHYQPYHYIYNEISLTQRKHKENLLKKYETQFKARLALQEKHSDAWGLPFQKDVAANYLQNALFMLLFNLKGHEGDQIKALNEIYESEVFQFSLKHKNKLVGITYMMRIKIFLFQNRLFSLLNIINNR